MDAVDAEIRSLLADTGASRVTLRQERPGEVFPVTHEALAAGAPPIRDVQTPNMAGQPVAVRAVAGEQVVQDDCRTAFPGDEPFHAMLELYGGMRAQIVTPIRHEGRTVALLSLHQLGRPRTWTAAEAQRCRDAADRIARALGLVQP